MAKCAGSISGTTIHTTAKVQNESGVEKPDWHFGQEESKPTQAVESGGIFTPTGMHLLHVLFYQDPISGWGSPEIKAERSPVVHLTGKEGNPSKNLSKYFWGKYWSRSLLRILLREFISSNPK